VSGVALGGLLLGLMLALLAGGVWVAMALAIVGWVGQALFAVTEPGKNLVSSFFGAAASWELASLPLFIWMGEILFRTRLSEQMFEGLAPWLRRVPGRLMHVTILGCGIFGSVSGSSAATCATIAKVALPELRKRGYDEELALGALATAGTLGILIPPSITMVVYAVAADASIIRIFLGGILPGLVLMVLFSGYIAGWSLRHPARVPPAGPPLPLAEKLRRSRQLLPVALLIAFVLWLLMAGWATATESAAFGVLGSLVIAAASRTLSFRSLSTSLLAATRLSCMIFFILGGAASLTRTMAFLGLPRQLAEWVGGLGLHPYALIAALTVLFILLGTALDGISMILLTAAVVLPLVKKAGFDLVWFGIFVVLLVEIAEVTPPVGFNLFVLQNMTGRDSNRIARAALPFFGLLVVGIALITLFPGLVTWLPNVLLGRDR
jgi:tripartite ATP-independent transporter DctM subunit